MTPGTHCVRQRKMSSRRTHSRCTGARTSRLSARRRAGRRGRAGGCAARAVLGAGADERVGVMVECSGCVVDPTIEVAAFNGAFEGHPLTKNGMRWTIETFADLLPRASMMGGTAGAMFRGWFGHSGWPRTISGGDLGREQFVRELTELKEESMIRILREGEFDLVKGFREFLVESCSSREDAVCIVMDSPRSWARSGDYEVYTTSVKRKICEAVGEEVFPRVGFVNPDDPRWDMSGGSSGGGAAASGGEGEEGRQADEDEDEGDIDDMMADMVRKFKQKQAAAAARSMTDVIVTIPDADDASVTPATLSAMAVLELGVAPSQVGFLASHAKTIRAAAASGCACVWGVRGATSRGADFNIIGATDAADGPRPNVKGA